MSNFFSISMPGTPKKVGKSGDMMWVKSTVPVNWRTVALACAMSGATAVAAKEAATAPLKKPRRESACRTAS